ncbi:hypothetical protein [Pseudoalteromonas sp. McH1-42]|uniref:hypothetical protein n=1 Tax=Pseudoalteromonas sp. McH1-42 TaxID=2917752 RepID=UPI001EF506B8|nr:hypothetical protein [Pseudoalteromonas sp. McH1-42]MCG7563089.1 hypothetical protein [Pseudoalteromonas sp. McH1-42]
MKSQITRSSLLELSRQYPIDAGIKEWRFRCTEVGPSQYSAEGEDTLGRKAGCSGVDFHETLNSCIQQAKDISQMTRKSKVQYQLNYKSEVKFGPAYYSLEIEGHKVPTFYYGFERSELLGGRYLAIQEWLTTDYRKGPKTRVAIFDLEKKLVSRLEIVEKGFVSDFRLTEKIFSYRRTYYANARVVDQEVDWDSIEKWSDIY